MLPSAGPVKWRFSAANAGHVSAFAEPLSHCGDGPFWRLPLKACVCGDRGYNTATCRDVASGIRRRSLWVRGC